MAENKKKFNEEELETLVRVFGQDIPGSKNTYIGLTKIKGISWSLSNNICKRLKLDKTKKISELSQEEIDRIEKFLNNPETPTYLKNRRNDPESGEDKHLLANDLDMRKEFDIKRLKKIKSYKGIRHSFKLPVRGQRTRSNFRKSGIAVGVKRKKK